ncbi:MAG: hypothetical protein H0T70_08900 [Acidimicrobiia bacterium]|nr:hypothetical protein [Acidimicrobiia bacterium]
MLLACDDDADGQDGSLVAVAELAHRLGGPVLRSARAEEHDLVEGDLLVMAVTASGSATGFPDPPDGAVIIAMPLLAD